MTKLQLHYINQGIVATLNEKMKEIKEGDYYYDGQTKDVRISYSTPNNFDKFLFGDYKIIYSTFLLTNVKLMKFYDEAEEFAENLLSASGIMLQGWVTPSILKRLREIISLAYKSNPNKFSEHDIRAAIIMARKSHYEEFDYETDEIISSLTKQPKYLEIPESELEKDVLIVSKEMLRYE